MSRPPLVPLPPPDIPPLDPEGRWEQRSRRWVEWAAARLAAARTFGLGLWGAETVDEARVALLVDQTNNTADLAKPISTATQAALDAITAAAVTTFQGLTDAANFTVPDALKVVRVNAGGTGLDYGAVLGSLASQSGTFSGTSSGTNTGDQTITLTGDVTGTGTGSFAATIANDAVTLAKMANMATASLLGRNTAGTGDPEVLSVATAWSLLSITNGTYTPVITFATPGTSSFTYASQVGQWTRVGNLIVVTFSVNFTPTIGTGSGLINVSLPFTALDTAGGSISNLNSAFTWPAGTTTAMIRIPAAGTTVNISGLGSAINRADFATTNLTGGVAHNIAGQVTYRVA